MAMRHSVVLDVKRCRGCTTCIKCCPTEAIRVRGRRATILPWYSRKASQDFSIDGFQVAKGASVNLDVVSIHYDAAVFADPERFDPDRFDVRAP